MTGKRFNYLGWGWVGAGLGWAGCTISQCLSVSTGDTFSLETAPPQLMVFLTVRNQVRSSHCKCDCPFSSETLPPVSAPPPG